MFQPGVKRSVPPGKSDSLIFFSLLSIYGEGVPR